MYMDTMSRRYQMQKAQLSSTIFPLAYSPIDRYGWLIVFQTINKAPTIISFFAEDGHWSISSSLALQLGSIKPVEAFQKYSSLVSIKRDLHFCWSISLQVFGVNKAELKRKLVVVLSCRKGQRSRKRQTKWRRRRKRRQRRRKRRRRRWNQS